MVVRPNRHARRPDHIQDRQIGRVIELLHLGAPRFADPGDDAGRVGDRARDDLAHRFVGPVRAQCATAILDKAIEIKHGPLPNSSAHS